MQRRLCAVCFESTDHVHSAVGVRGQVFNRARLAGDLQARARRARAAGLVLRRAWLVADELGAVWLKHEATALARRARIDLDPDVQPRPLPAAPSPAQQLGLTPREREVLALVADGRTNRQIAQTLYITDKTASVHVSRILAKLGVANRAEAAAVAHRLRLTS